MRAQRFLLVVQRQFRVTAMSVNSTWAVSSFVVWPGMDDEVTSRASYACVQIGVENISNEAGSVKNVSS
jgi:hypothetical protein